MGGNRLEHVAVQVLVDDHGVPLKGGLRRRWADLHRHHW
jgi:hypothetical protein